MKSARRDRSRQMNERKKPYPSKLGDGLTDSILDSRPPAGTRHPYLRSHVTLAGIYGCLNDLGSVIPRFHPYALAVTFASCLPRCIGLQRVAVFLAAHKKAHNEGRESTIQTCEHDDRTILLQNYGTRVVSISSEGFRARCHNCRTRTLSPF
jgi:hypothetical protein